MSRLRRALRAGRTLGRPKLSNSDFSGHLQRLRRPGHTSIPSFALSSRLNVGVSRGVSADEASGFQPLQGVAPGSRLTAQQFETIVRSPRYLSNFTALSWMSYRDFAHDSGEGRPWKGAVLPFDASHDAVQATKELLVTVGGEIVDLTHEGQFKGVRQAGQRPSDAQVLVAYNVSVNLCGHEMSARRTSCRNICRIHWTLQSWLFAEQTTISTISRRWTSPCRT